MEDAAKTEVKEIRDRRRRMVVMIMAAVFCVPMVLGMATAGLNVFLH